MITQGTALEITKGCTAYGPLGQKGTTCRVAKVEYKPLFGAVKIVVDAINGKRNIAGTLVVWLRYEKHLNNETIRVHRGNPLETLELRVRN